jgi:hypothetical protein
MIDPQRWQRHKRPNLGILRPAVSRHSSLARPPISVRSKLSSKQGQNHTIFCSFLKDWLDGQESYFNSTLLVSIFDLFARWKATIERTVRWFTVKEKHCRLTGRRGHFLYAVVCKARMQMQSWERVYRVVAGAVLVLISQTCLCLRTTVYTSANELATVLRWTRIIQLLGPSTFQIGLMFGQLVADVSKQARIGRNLLHHRCKGTLYNTWMDLVDIKKTT